MPVYESIGNMYPWVTHTWCPWAGACDFDCYYCYVKKGRSAGAPRHQGPIRLLQHEMSATLYPDGKKDNTIFVGHQVDMFAPDIAPNLIQKVLCRCAIDYPENVYMFQTKNPARYRQFFLRDPLFKKGLILGITVETDEYPEPKVMLKNGMKLDIEYFSKAPAPAQRVKDFNEVVKSMREMKRFQEPGMLKTFVTIEPIMAFNPDKFADMITSIHPDFGNVGADSKNCGLPEPSKADCLKLIASLEKSLPELKLKGNIDRIIDPVAWRTNRRR